MKKLLLFIVFLCALTEFSVSQIVTNNFENGSWSYYSNRCWGIGPNNSYFGTTVTANSQSFTGSKVCRTANLGQTPACRLESPWINLYAGNITFDHGVPNFNGYRALSVYLLDTLNNRTKIFDHIYTSSVSNSATIVNSVTGIRKVQWEWTSTETGNSRGELDNISIPGEDVSDPSNSCKWYCSILDSTIINYYPAEDTSTLAFEDLWPTYGDYDMNDMVIGYKFKMVSKLDKVSDIYCTVIVRASGAGFSNGFGFQLQIPTSSVVSVQGTGDQTGYSILPNGTEGGQTLATVIVFNNQKKFMTSWNTIPDNPAGQYKVFEIHIKLKSNFVTLSQLSIHNWNPFIVVNGYRGKEVHLPNHKPTNLADTSLFGTGNDDTQVGIKYYKSSTNLSWAIDIYGKFDYPIEKADISNAYLHFRDWVISNGIQYLDWWSNQSSGYRNTFLIY